MFPRLSRVSWKLRWRSPARTGREVGVGRPPRHHRRGTAVTKKYQKNNIDTPTDGEGLLVPERVSVAMAEIAGSMREGLLALAVGTGLQVMQVLMEADVTRLAGPKGRHDPNRSAVRHGHERGSVTLGGRRGAVRRARVRAADGAGGGAPPRGARGPAGAGLRAFPRHRDPRVDGDGPDAGRAVDPPLPGRPGTGRRTGHRLSQVDEQVRGLTEVRGGPRARAGRTAGCGPDRPGPGRADGRRGAL